MRQFSAELMRQGKNNLNYTNERVRPNVALKPIHGLKLFLQAISDQPMHPSFNKERINGLEVSVESSHTSGNKSIGP